MSEDVSATMRVGITVILVAALVATVLNLMVMTNSLLSGGQTTLQSGIDSVSQQEFSSYDNTKVSGTQVATALSLFQGRDVAVVIQTSAFATLDDTFAASGAVTKGVAHKYAINYGALLTQDGKASASNNFTPIFEGDGSGWAFHANAGCTPYSDKDKFIAKGGNIITSQAKTAYIIKWIDGPHNEDPTAALYREAGAAYYTGYLHNSNGLVDSSYDTIGTTELGNAAYLLSSARFSSVLIKDPTGSIIGIFFRQLN